MNFLKLLIITTLSPLLFWSCNNNKIASYLVNNNVAIVSFTFNKYVNTVSRDPNKINLGSFVDALSGANKSNLPDEYFNDFVDQYQNILEKNNINVLNINTIHDNPIYQQFYNSDKYSPNKNINAYYIPEKYLFNEILQNHSKLGKSLADELNVDAIITLYVIYDKVSSEKEINLRGEMLIKAYDNNGKKLFAHTYTKYLDKNLRKIKFKNFGLYNVLEKDFEELKKLLLKDFDDYLSEMINKTNQSNEKKLNQENNNTTNKIDKTKNKKIKKDKKLRYKKSGDYILIH